MGGRFDIVLAPRLLPFVCHLELVVDAEHKGNCTGPDASNDQIACIVHYARKGDVAQSIYQ